MSIQILVESVTVTREGIGIAFGTSMRGRDNELTQEGARALRILMIHAADFSIDTQPYHDTADYFLIKTNGGRIPELETQQGVQKLMDVYGKGDIKVTFQEPKLYASQNGSVRGDGIQPRQLADSLKSGKFVRAQMVFALSLPVLNSDSQAVRSVLRDECGVATTAEVKNGMRVYVRVRTDSEDPLMTLRRLQPRIAKALR
ncbi:MAG TPA: hypothetical protein VD907_02905 [Verrucomicrobiae bacterium]|nr:hypothetical protein [Verrucomicrobiae bacterium]